MELKKRHEVKAVIVFDSAFHLGSGEAGSAATDMGVLTDPFGDPLIPGSSLKGVFRSTAEALAGHLGMRACFLEKENGWCAGGDDDLGKDKLKKLERAHGDEVETILQESLCHTCRLFGSVLAKGKTRFLDTQVVDWAEVLEIRDGVGIDRDSGTAVKGVKYDYEAVPAGARFSFEAGFENLEPRETALVFAVLKEWSRRFHLGGMTSRGFGAAHLEDLEIREVDFQDKDQRLQYLLNHEMQLLDESAVQGTIKEALEEASHA